MALDAGTATRRGMMEKANPQVTFVCMKTVAVTLISKHALSAATRVVVEVEVLNTVAAMKQMVMVTQKMSVNHHQLR